MVYVFKYLLVSLLGVLHSHQGDVSPSNRAMYTTGGTAPEHSRCHFPFDAISFHPTDGKYHVQTHQYCAYSAGENKPWCSLGPQMWKDNSSSLWGYCDLDKVYAIGGSIADNSTPRPCLFPFHADQVTYLGCTDDPLTGRSGGGLQGKLWCATEQNGRNTTEWGYCLVDEEVVTESGRNCSFPFNYRGKEMTTCTTLDSVPEDEVRLWCDVDGRGDWDYCITTTKKWNITEMLRMVAASKTTESATIGNRIEDHDHDHEHHLNQGKSTWPPSDDERKQNKDGPIVEEYFAHHLITYNTGAIVLLSIAGIILLIFVCILGNYCIEKFKQTMGGDTAQFNRETDYLQP